MTNDATAHWRVEAAGEGGPPILLLPGSLGRAETMRPALEFLARKRRTFAVSYVPRGINAEAAADEIETLLAAEGFRNAHLVGFSLGAQVARNVTAMRPGLAASVVLVGSGAPDEARGKRVARALPLLRLLPAFLLRRRWRAEVDFVLTGGAPENAEARSRLHSLIGTMPRREFVGSRERLLVHDWTAIRHHSVPAPIPLLRLDLERDEVISPRDRELLSRIEPRAVVETLPGLGHGAVLTLPRILLERIESWCDRCS